ncbi:MAG: hypothetical protein RSC78_02140, partial [Acidaminococcaceae bacterium]
MTLKKYKIPYGRGWQEVSLPEEHLLYDIHGNKATTQGDLPQATLAALRQPIESEPLQKIVVPGD